MVLFIPFICVFEEKLIRSFMTEICAMCVPLQNQSCYNGFEQSYYEFMYFLDFSWIVQKFLTLKVTIFSSSSFCGLEFEIVH